MSRSLSIVAALAMLLAAGVQAAVRPAQLKCDYRTAPLGVDLRAPGLTWIIETSDASARGLRQKAYQVLVASSETLLRQAKPDLWDSGKVVSDRMAHIPYAGGPLTSRQRCWWTVRIWEESDAEPSDYAPAATWTMGLLEESDWQATWISAPGLGDTSGPLPLFRRDFHPDKPIERALISICGLGSYELSVNGRKVGDQVLDPGWTNYRKRCLYAVYDVTEQLRPIGPTAAITLGVALGNGMYNVRGGRYVKLLGSFGPPKFILQLHVTYADGTSEQIVSDASWKTSPGPVTFSCIYGGEDYDARREQTGWDAPGFDSSRWQSVRVVEGPGGKLVSQSAPPIKVLKVFQPVNLSEPKPGVFVYDLGQNLSGWPDLAVRGPAGRTVKLIPGELLDANGSVSQASSGGSMWFSYTLKGATGSDASGIEHWHPHFSYYGFRYVQVEGAVPVDRATPAGMEENPVVVELQSQFVHSAATVTGQFDSSEPLLNRTHDLILAAIESNLQSVLTDCPHREKLGWLEVSHLLGPAIMFNFDVPLLYRKICDDMADAQLENGLIPDIAPEYTVFSGGFRDSPEWGSACVVNPWLLYERYGDWRPLSTYYSGMSRYADYLGSRALGHIVSHGLGDWYDIGPNPPGESQLTSKGVTATAVYYHDLELLRHAAALLGRDSDVSNWASRAADVRAAFNARFFHPATGHYDRGSQTANALALVLGLVEPERAGDVLATLVRDVRARTNQVTAGDVGFRFLVEALRHGGRSDVLLDMVTRTEGPGYADQLRRGATALTEAWDANPASSQNHCMLGHVEEWFYTGLAGLNPDPAGPGFRKMIIQPAVVGNIAWVRAAYNSASGRIESGWSRAGDRVTFEVSVPPNTSATIHIPTSAPGQVKEGDGPAEQARSVRPRTMSPRTAVYELGSGRYRFTAPPP